MYRTSKKSLVPTPSEVADRERIFERPGTIRDVHTDELLGHCTIGSSLSGILRDPIPSELLGLFQQEQYLIWFDQRCLLRQSYATETPNTCVRRIHICLKEGHTLKDHFMAWIHAAEVCRIGFQIRGSAKLDNVAALGVVRDAYNAATSHIADFTTKLESVGWSPGDYALMTGSPNAVVTYVASAATDVQKDKKSQWRSKVLFSSKCPLSTKDPNWLYHSRFRIPRTWFEIWVDPFTNEIVWFIGSTPNSLPYARIRFQQAQSTNHLSSNPFQD